MNDKVFLDTNVLIYSYSNSEFNKQAVARKLIAEGNSFVSTQVLQELTNAVTRKLHFGYTDAINVVNECMQNNNLHINTSDTILKACQIADRYHFSFYDSLIIAAAIECNCATLYSEDLQHNQLIDNKLKIVNPFQ